MRCTQSTHFVVSSSEVTALMLVEVRILGEDQLGVLGGWVEGLAGVGSLGLLTLGEADNAACNSAALAFLEAALTVVGLLVFGLVVIVLSLVDNH